jgi:hypothetical protein
MDGWLDIIWHKSIKPTDTNALNQSQSGSAGVSDEA